MQLPKETVLTVTSVVPSALTVPLWVPAICSTLSLPGARVFIGKVQVPQVTDSIEPLTNSACSSLPFAVDSEHSSIVKPSVLTSVALVPDLRLKSRLVPAAQRLASGQGVSWVVQKTELAVAASAESEITAIATAAARTNSFKFFTPFLLVLRPQTLLAGSSDNRFAAYDQ